MAKNDVDKNKTEAVKRQMLIDDKQRTLREGAKRQVMKVNGGGVSLKDKAGNKNTNDGE